MQEIDTRLEAADTELTVRLSPLELGEIDAWAADQADKPSRPEAVRRLLRQAIGARTTPGDQGLRPDELNAENDG